MQHISKNEKSCVLKQVWLTNVLFFIRLSKVTNHEKRQFKELPKLSCHF